MFSFFDHQYITPHWFKQKLSRRHLLKSAAGASAIAALPRYAFASQVDIEKIIANEPWQTLNAVLNHLLPSSNSGPGAKEIQATNYLYQTVTQQPIDSDEKAFIYKGVGWLNGYSQSQLSKDFIQLNEIEKETTLKAISSSKAGENWLNTLLNYIFEAMLSPPIYGGNPNGIGWQWLKHQAGYPLPQKGQRYYEIPGRYAIAVKNIAIDKQANNLNKLERKTVEEKIKS